MQKEQLDATLNNLDQQILKEIHPYFSFIPEYPLYHYTTVEGFKGKEESTNGIIASRKLRMTDYRHLDDKKEIEYAFNAIQEDIRAFFKLFPEELLQQLENLFYKNINIFTLSICKVRDHAHMWEKYAANGTGFAIGFKPDCFKPSDQIQDQEHTVTIKIHYDRKDIKSIMKKLFDLVNSSLPEISYSREAINKINAYLLAHLCSLIPAIKPDEDKYKIEHEHRLYRVQIKANSSIFPKGQKEFEVKSNNSKDYIERQLADEEIYEIILGPNCNYSKSDIIDYLKSNKYDTANIMITKSEVKPYILTGSC